MDIGKGITSAASGSGPGLHLMVVDIEASRADLFGKRYGRRDREGSFAEAKLQRLGNISLIVSNCELCSESGRLMKSNTGTIATVSQLN